MPRGSSTKGWTDTKERYKEKVEMARRLARITEVRANKEAPTREINVHTTSRADPYKKTNHCEGGGERRDGKRTLG